MSMNVAITGATGYIGAHFVRALKAQGHRVHAMGRRPTAEADAFIPFALGETNDYTPLAHSDALIHCAYDFTCLGETDIAKVNCDGSAELFMQAKAHGVKKIIYLSSLSAFENAVSDYGRLKFETEFYARGVDALIVRPGLVFSKNAGGIVGALGRMVEKLPCLPIVGRGDQIFYPCHIDDLSKLAVHLIAGDVRETVPIAAACEQTVNFRKIIAIIAQSHRKRIVMIPVPYPLMYAMLKTAESLHLKTGMRSDSLKYMKHINQNPDFSFIHKAGLTFRPFTPENLSV